MTQKKISNYIRFFILLLPIFIIIVATYRNGDVSYIDTAFNVFFDTIPPIFNDIGDFLSSEFSFDSNLFTFAFNYLIYVFCIELTMLIFDFILFIPRWIRGLIFSYEKKNKN